MRTRASSVCSPSFGTRELVSWRTARPSGTQGIPAHFPTGSLDRKTRLPNWNRTVFVAVRRADCPGRRPLLVRGRPAAGRVQPLDRAGIQVVACRHHGELLAPDGPGQEGLARAQLGRDA